MVGGGIYALLGEVAGQAGLATPLALWRIKGSSPDREGKGPRFPRWLPLLAFIVTALVLLYRLPLESIM